jgi:hypothetical protein
MSETESLDHFLRRIGEEYGEKLARLLFEGAQAGLVKLVSSEASLVPRPEPNSAAAFLESHPRYWELCAELKATIEAAVEAHAKRIPNA